MTKWMEIVINFNSVIGFNPWLAGQAPTTYHDHVSRFSF